MLKLIACAQNGIMTTEPILATKAPLPDFSGNTPRAQYISPPSQDTISPEDRLKYINLFQSLGPVNNTLNGERAKQAFIRSNLPPTILQAIWNLADTRKSGSLNQTEFIIAMHYIENAMKGMTQLPPSLPSNIYASATGRSMTASPLVRSNTLQISSPPPVPMRSPVFKGATMTPVGITPEEYSKYQTFFRQLDTDQSGFVTGADAVVFFKHSKLPESDLARIWDLADTNSAGQLTEQEFAIAMHLINRRIAGGDIPNSLPAFNSIPQQQQPFPPPSQQQQQFPPRSQQEQVVDLLGLSSDFTGTPMSAPQPQQNTSDLQRTQSVIQSSVQTELTRAQNASNQLQNESQAVQELTRQIEEQKEILAKKKQEADEAERQLEAQKKKKEELTKELQMYKQEVKHFNSRVENIKEETEKLQKENAELEKQKSASQPALEKNSQDFFSLSASRPVAGGSSTNLFAKIAEDTTSPNSGATSPLQQQTKFDPFSGFKATQNKPSSPTVSLNKLKQETEIKRTGSPNVDISDIESKFPDLNTMEQNFTMTPTSPSFAQDKLPTSPKPASVVSPKSSAAVAPSPSVSTSKKEKSKYGFDLSAFEPPSSPFSGGDSKTSMKDELSSLFGSPSVSHAQTPATQQNTKTGFDDIFGTTTNNKSSFEDIFMQK
ncbi:uncharacterized protein B0P05DRAFT_531840 [Gilbertella persicaria]|uniref:uncharacterized protein n=1 Tax=Gilbertella persicaria TaxID=101096 RepID=UPI00221EC76F|nr:uncharacterized protein B0P05DRAFT_531840 [Gilbertella persicaria]KAI8087663.1 hypothetical protein B0P05DRAFT_531840 [Gilbertella persicaria]